MTALAERHRVARELKAIDPDRPAGRKTTKTRKPRAVGTPTYVAPDLTLVFRIPKNILVAEGKHPGGVFITALGTAEVVLKTFNRDALFQAALKFLAKVIPSGLPPVSVAATFTSSSEPNFRMQWWLSIIDGHGIATVSPIGPLIFPAPRK
jgi:hypothetical protein